MVKATKCLFTLYLGKEKEKWQPNRWSWIRSKSTSLPANCLMGSGMIQKRWERIIGEESWSHNGCVALTQSALTLTPAMDVALASVPSFAESHFAVRPRKKERIYRRFKYLLSL